MPDPIERVAYYATRQGRYHQEWFSSKGEWPARAAREGASLDEIRRAAYAYWRLTECVSLGGRWEGVARRPEDDYEVEEAVTILGEPDELIPKEVDGNAERRRAWLKQALAKLDSEQRLAIELAWGLVGVRKCSTREIARVIGKSQKTAWRRYTDAMWILESLARDHDLALSA